MLKDDIANLLCGASIAFSDWRGNGLIQKSSFRRTPIPGD
jgi:hypothetical protein